MSRIALVVLLTICVSFLTVGCDTAGSSSDSSQESDQVSSTKIQKISGKDIYRGFLFGQGKVASMFPEVLEQTAPRGEVLETADQRIQGMSKEELRRAYKKSQQVSPEKYKRLTNSLFQRLTQRVQQKNPQFFDRFERLAKSGNPLKVQRALTSMKEVTLPAMASILDVSKEALVGDNALNVKSGQQVCVAFVVAVVVAAAGTMTVAVNVNVAYNVNRVVNTNPREPEEETKTSDRLRDQIIVDLIAERLAV